MEKYFSSHRILHIIVEECGHETQYNTTSSQNNDQEARLLAAAFCRRNSTSVDGLPCSRNPMGEPRQSPAETSELEPAQKGLLDDDSSSSNWIRPSMLLRRFLCSMDN